MPDLDTPAVAYLDHAEVIRPAFFAWLDILGDPIRATTIGHDLTLASTGDSELDGAYVGVDPRLIDIGQVTHEEGGSATVSASLSGLLLPDAELLETIGDKANWQGRIARLWIQVRDASGNGQGAIAPYYTGYMTSLNIAVAPDKQTIELQIENYLVSLSEASNRTYQSQGLYDSADTSASATISSANNAKTGQAANAATGPYMDPAYVKAVTDYGWAPAI